MSFVRHVFGKESADKVQIADIEKLIENETQESLHLDFEEIPRKDVRYDGLAKHVSGFLNTSGGIVVFGLSERKKKGRNIAHKTTWTTIKKEAVENNLYQRIDPWNEAIQIFPIENPDDASQRIFVINVPRSKNPPHMANFTYYIRLNFQTKPIGHEQVSAIFKQYYLQRYDLVNTVYGQLYNELVSYFIKDGIKAWVIEKYKQIRRERLFLLEQDSDLSSELEDFYGRVDKWNQAVSLAHHRLTQIINKVASDFFRKQMQTPTDRSAVSLEIKAESTHQFPLINDAVLNRKDPIEFWRDRYPFDRIFETKYILNTYNSNGERKEVIEEKQFKAFMVKLSSEVEKDELIQFIWNEFDNLQNHIETLLDELEDKMA